VEWLVLMAVKIIGRVRFGSLLLIVMSVVRTDQTVVFEYTHYVGVVPSGAVRVPQDITVEVSSGDNGCVSEPATMFHKTSMNLPDVIVGTLAPDWTLPDRKQIEIYRPMNSNGNDPPAEQFVHCLKRQPPAQKTANPLFGLAPNQSPEKPSLRRTSNDFLEHS
jgi:hypothetical protein